MYNNKTSKDAGRNDNIHGDEVDMYSKYHDDERDWGDEGDWDDEELDRICF